jgi:hypothetical protein
MASDFDLSPIPQPSNLFKATFFCTHDKLF